MGLGLWKFCSGSGTRLSLTLCWLWKFFADTAWILLEELLGVPERCGKQWVADGGGRDGGNIKVSLCTQ